MNAKRDAQRLGNDLYRYFYHQEWLGDTKFGVILAKEYEDCNCIEHYVEIKESEED